METPKVSIVMAIYNRADMLRESIKNIFLQTYKNFELIIIDDGSKEDLKAVVDEFKDKRIIYKRLEKNGGVPVARNEGTKLATGKYIAVRDSDDFDMPERIEKQVKALEESGADICYSDRYNVDQEEEEWLRQTVTHKIGVFGVWKMFHKGMHTPHPTIMAKKECFENFPYDKNYPASSDYHLCLRWAVAFDLRPELNKNKKPELGYTFHHLEEPLVRHYKHKESISDARSEEQEALAKKARDSVLASVSEFLRNELMFKNRVQFFNDNSVKASVIILFYKGFEKLVKTLMALRNQTYKDFEIILCDDGGEEHLKDIIKEFRKTMEIKYYEHLDRGYTLNSIRNAGLRLANGEVLIFLDYDMIPEKQYVEKIVKLHDYKRNLLLITGRNRVDEKGKVISGEDREIDEEHTWRMMGGGSFSIRRENAILIGEFDIMYNGYYGVEDLDYSYRARKKGIDIAFHPEIIASHQGEIRPDHQQIQDRNSIYFWKKKRDGLI